MPQKNQSKKGKRSQVNKPARARYRIENRRAKNKRLKQERHKRRFPDS